MTKRKAVNTPTDGLDAVVATKPVVKPHSAWSERMIAKALCHDIWHHKHLMMIPKCHWTGHECDVMTVTENLRIIDIEIKISRADLRADKDKEKWYHRYNWRLDGPQVKKDLGADVQRRREWPQKVWKHYVAVPESVWKDDLFEMLSPQSGVILLRHNTSGKVVARMLRQAKPNRDAETLSAEQVMNIARLATLRMWDAYEQVDHGREIAHRDAVKMIEMVAVSAKEAKEFAKTEAAAKQAKSAAKKAVAKVKPEPVTEFFTSSSATSPISMLVITSQIPHSTAAH